MTTSETTVSRSTQSGGPYRVMVVDDSAIIRGFLSRYLSDDAQIDVVTTANNGLVALRQLENYDIEVVVLDIEMPEMDGMTALPKMLERIPDLQVVMASTLTRKNADISMRAMQIGAVDYVPKPETARSVNASIDFRRELVEKVKAWARKRRQRRGEGFPQESGADGARASASGLGAVGQKTDQVSGQNASPPNRLQAGFVSVQRPVLGSVTVASARAVEKEPTTLGIFNGRGEGKTITLRPASKARPLILAIGSSTGGPQALMKFFAAFKEAPTVPVVITQHMPATFTAILADHLRQATGWPAAEARDGEALKAGHIYVAPGGRHLEVAGTMDAPVAKLTDAPPENFCRPAVDPLFRSLSALYNDKLLAVVLTGMGHDGMKGARDIVRLGGTVVAQDEATSVVWGMPGAVATTGLCSEVMSLDRLASHVADRLKRGV